MPRGNFFVTLADLVRIGGSQNVIGAALRGRGFRIGNDSLRGLINALRGNRLSVNQIDAVGKTITSTRFNFRIPQAIRFVIRVRARYELNRDEFGRAPKTLLSGTVTETLNLKIPVDADAASIVREQANQRVIETIDERVRSQGLAQAGNYLVPDITIETEIVSSEFTDFIEVGSS